VSPARPLLAVLVLTAVASCAGGEATEQASPVASIEGHTAYPLAYDSCDLPMTVERPPRRAVANDANMVATVLELGLADRLAGISGIADRRRLLEQRYGTGWTGTRELSAKYFTRESLLGAEPDFVFAGYNYGFAMPGTDGVTPEELIRLGIPSYAIRESCPDRTGPIGLEDTYRDSLRIGEVFDVPGRAQRVVEQMRHRVAKATPADGTTPVPVFVYDSGEQTPFTAGGTAIPNDIIASAGGRNIFADLKDSWTSVGWEQVVARSPEFIVIVDYGEVTAQQKEEFLRTNPVTRQLPAVQNDRMLVLPYLDVTPGPGNVEAVEQLAAALAQAGTS